MIVYNKSRREARSRLAWRRAERPFLKFKVGMLKDTVEYVFNVCWVSTAGGVMCVDNPGAAWMHNCA